jgi:hypothetical protein
VEQAPDGLWQPNLEVRELRSADSAPRSLLLAGPVAAIEVNFVPKWAGDAKKRPESDEDCCRQTFYLLIHCSHRGCWLGWTKQSADEEGRQTMDQLLWAHDFVGTDRNPNTKGSGRTATAVRQADGQVRVKVIGAPFLTNDPMIVVSDATFTAEQFERFEPAMLAGMGVKEAK